MSGIKITKREETRTNKVKKIRAKGYIPGIVYGHGSENINISILKSDIDKFLFSNNEGAQAELALGKKKIKVVLKNIQRDPVSRFVVHLDFQALKAGEKIKIKIPVYVIGKDNVEDSMTVVQETLRQIEITALPKDLIDGITVDVTGKKIGDSIKISDLIALIPEEVEINEDIDKIVVSVIKKIEIVDEVEEVEEIEGVEEKEEKEEKEETEKE